MNAYLVGADVLGNIPDLLNRYGITIHKHVSGRHAAHQRKPASLKGVDLIILFTDFLGHNVMRHYRDMANEENIRFVACRRSVCSLSQTLDKLGHCATNPCDTCPQRKLH
ncbi:DUF2325 domain-containing protein [Jeongeupia naejangsanensis]|uniref:DUF2325 domain-containing protein n=1 Tax=Jeongeupia naejangsanensis TaxID=613195 RepID=A0ABS2BI26_9NEIS|nr:DUF2325 domain-containing protein [Jeongeupia naejangsanensis]MBM3115260.1 DUF2325 domain-containing protein [Jeongeupia naejangsanensis]